MTHYTRVKHKETGHEFDVPVEQFDEKKHDRLDRYPDTSRPRRPKPKVSKGGKPSESATADAPKRPRSPRRTTKATDAAATPTGPVDNTKKEQ